VRALLFLKRDFIVGSYENSLLTAVHIRGGILAGKVFARPTRPVEISSSPSVKTFPQRFKKM